MAAQFLRTPDRSRAELFVHTGQEMDVVGLEKPLRPGQLRIVAAQWGATVTRYETTGFQSRGTVETGPVERNPDQSLNAGQIDLPARCDVFVVQRNPGHMDIHTTSLLSIGNLAGPSSTPETSDQYHPFRV